MRSVFTPVCLVLGAVLLFGACRSNSACNHFQGDWSDHEGHRLVFFDNGKGLWLNHFGQLIDTVEFAFSIHCNTSPVSIDMTAFKTGPFVGKTLFGIMDFSGDTLFRLSYDVGRQPDVRPRVFAPDQTMKFYR